jgi:hypothetical protein
MFVPVVDQDQHPLMPTTPSRARRWIKSGKATAFWKGGFFCVRLNVRPTAREYQPVACGIDPGSKKEALAVASAAHTYASIQVDAVTWVKEAEAQSTRMRRTRRNRETPCRKPRQNRSFSPLEVGKNWFYNALQCVLDNRRLVCISPLQLHRRQLHRLEPELLKLLRWRTRLLPLPPTPKKGTPTSSPVGTRGVSAGGGR